MFDNARISCYNMHMKESLLKEIYEFIEEYNSLNGYSPSVREICFKCNIKSTATAHSYIEKLKNKGLIEKKSQKKRTLTLSGQNQFKKIPLIGTITAGQPIYAVENLEGYYPLPPDFNQSDNIFALKVKGNSMIDAGIFDKDVVIVKKQDTAENGEIVIALIDDSATVKRFYKANDKIILHPENASMSDIILKEVQILGTVIGLFRKM